MANYENMDNGEKWIEHYSSSHKILLVGEGDFSFAVSLAKAFGSANNIVATSYISQGMVKLLHSKSATHLRELEEMGCTVLHDVDAKNMSFDARIRWKSFDRIVYNFPHAGFPCREDSESTIERHQDLVRGFLESAYELLAIDGEVHVTHKTTKPYSKWEIEKLAEDVGLHLVEKARFCKYDYPGYQNKRGSGISCDLTFLLGECSTFKFSKS